LRNRKQKPGEMIEEYIAAMEELWKRIDPQNNRSEMDRLYKFIEGLRQNLSYQYNHPCLMMLKKPRVKPGIGNCFFYGNGAICVFHVTRVLAKYEWKNDTSKDQYGYVSTSIYHCFSKTRKYGGNGTAKNQ
jgi:hypothetical protein